MFSPNIWKRVPNHEPVSNGSYTWAYQWFYIWWYHGIFNMVIASCYFTMWSCYFTMGLSVHIVPSSHNCGADGELVAWTNRMPLIISMLKAEYDIQVDINSATKKIFRSGNLGKSKHWLCNLTSIFLWYNWYNHWLQMLQSFRPRCQM